MKALSVIAQGIAAIVAVVVWVVIVVVYFAIAIPLYILYYLCATVAMVVLFSFAALCVWGYKLVAFLTPKQR